MSIEDNKALTQPFVSGVVNGRNLEHGRRSSLLWILGLVAVLVIGAVVGWLVLADDGTEPTVDAEIEQEITALIDGWRTAWNTADGQGALDLFAANGRFVAGATDMDGWSGEELSSGIERWGGTYSSVRIGSPLIIERPNSYQVVQKMQPHEGYGREYFELYNIVEENGSLKIRYAEGLQPLGWFQVAEGFPYQPVDAGE